MSTWIILSWVFVLILTGINIFIFMKLKSASEQMMKVAFPGAKDMNEALSQMQSQMGAMRGMPRGGRGFGGPGRAGPKGPGGSDAQLKAAMDMLQKLQKPKKK